MRKFKGIKKLKKQIKQIKQIKQRKYSTFTIAENKIFSENQIEVFKERVRKIQAIFEMTMGKYNAKRLSDYPAINNGITHKGVCLYCNKEKELIRFDETLSLCKSCASAKNLI